MPIHFVCCNYGNGCNNEWFSLHSCMYLNMFICDGNLTFKSIHKNNYEEQLETI